MRKYGSILFTCILLLLISVPAMAEIRVSASVSEREVEVGEPVTLTVSIQGEIDVAAPSVQVPGCQVQYYGPSTQVSIVNGRRTSSISHLYSIVPEKVGTVAIPPIEVEVNRRSYRTEAVEFTAVEAGQGSSQGMEKQWEDYIFLEVEVGRDTVYLNEDIPLTIRLVYRNGIDLENIKYPEIKSEHVLIQPFPEPEQTMEYRNGEAYHVIVFQTTVKALKLGTLDLGTVGLSTDVLVPQKGTGGWSAFSFGYDYYPLKLRAPHQTLEIKDFPTKGKPEDFKGAVGRFQMDVTVNPEEVKPGEPITIRTRIVGDGSFTSVTAPTIAASSEFKYYDPQDVTGKPAQGQSAPKEKVFEQIVIPNAGATALPLIRFSYFDPEDGKYHTLTHGPTPIRVSGSNNTPRQVADYRQNQKASQLLGEDIVYIKNRPGRLTAIGQNPFLSPGFVGYNLALMAVLGGSICWCRRQNRVSPDDRRHKETRVRTQQVLTHAEQLLQERKPVEFYDAIYQAVQNYLKDKFQIAITGISGYEIEHLQKAGVSEEVLEMLRQFYDSIDEKRFAGALGTDAEMREVLELARGLIQRMEKGEVA